MRPKWKAGPIVKEEYKRHCVFIPLRTPLSQIIIYKCHVKAVASCELQMWHNKVEGVYGEDSKKGRRRGKREIRRDKKCRL